MQRYNFLHIWQWMCAENALLRAILFVYSLISAQIKKNVQWKYTATTSQHYTTFILLRRPVTSATIYIYKLNYIMYTNSFLPHSAWKPPKPGWKPLFSLIYLNYELKMQVFWNFFLKTLASNRFLLYLCIRFRERTKPQAKRD